MKQLEAKRIEKERNEKYQKLKGDAKDARAKYREKYKLDASPDPSDAEDESDEDDEDDGFGATKKKEEDLDPAASKLMFFHTPNVTSELTMMLYFCVFVTLKLKFNLLF